MGGESHVTLKRPGSRAATRQKGVLFMDFKFKLSKRISAVALTAVMTAGTFASATPALAVTPYINVSGYASTMNQVKADIAALEAQMAEDAEAEDTEVEDTEVEDTEVEDTETESTAKENSWASGSTYITVSNPIYKMDSTTLSIIGSVVRYQALNSAN